MKTKTIRFLAIIAVLGSINTINAQQLLTPYGGYVEEGGKVLSFSMGEIIVSSLLGDKGNFTQGFQQPEILDYSNELKIDAKEGLIIDDPFGNGNFFIKGLIEYPNNKLLVFNRWGDIVFQATPYQNDWNGYYNGAPLPQATYYYIFYPEADRRRASTGNIYILNK